MKNVQKFKLTRCHPPWCPVSKKYLKTPQKTKKTGQKYKNDPKRAKNCKIGHFSSGPQSIILKIAWNDLSICILTGLGSTFWVTEKSGQKWFHGSVFIAISMIIDRQWSLIITVMYESGIHKAMNSVQANFQCHRKL